MLQCWAQEMHFPHNAPFTIPFTICFSLFLGSISLPFFSHVTFCFAAPTPFVSVMCWYVSANVVHSWSWHYPIPTVTWLIILVTIGHSQQTDYKMFLFCVSYLLAFSFSHSTLYTHSINLSDFVKNETILCLYLFHWHGGEQIMTEFSFLAELFYIIGYKW